MIEPNVVKHYVLLTKSHRSQLPRAFVIQAPPWAPTSSFHSPSDQSTKQAVPRRRPQLCQIPNLHRSGGRTAAGRKSREFKAPEVNGGNKDFEFEIWSVYFASALTQDMSDQIFPEEVPTSNNSVPSAVPTDDFHFQGRDLAPADFGTLRPQLSRCARFLFPTRVMHFRFFCCGWLWDCSRAAPNQF